MTALSPGGQTKGGGNQHWCTPLWIVKLVRQVFGRAPDLDPFSNPQSMTGASEQWWGPDAVDGPHRKDGFVEPWGRMGIDLTWQVFFNNPWSRTGDAVRKASAEWHQWGATIEIIGLFPCSMNARHWPLVEQAPARCYFRKRPSFVENGKAKKGNPKDVVCTYWGMRPYWFAHVFSEVARPHFGKVAA